MKKHFVSIIFFICCFSLGNIVAQNNVDSLKKLLSGNLQDTERVNVLVKITKLLDDQYDTSERSYALQALSLAKKSNYDWGIATSYLMLGLADQTGGNFVEAIKDQQQSYEVYARLNDTLGQAKSLGNMANNEYFIGDYTAAVDHAYQALRFYEILNNYEGQFAMHLAIGNVLIEQKSFDLTLKQYREALRIAYHFPTQPEFKGRALTNIGNVYNAMQSYDSAAYYYQKGETIFSKENAVYELSVCLNNLGTIRQFQKKYNEAGELFRRSLTLRRVNGDTSGVCSTFQNLGSLSNDLNHHDSALYFYSYALRIAYIMESKSQRLGCYEGIAIAFAGLNKFDSAYYFLDRYKSLNDSVKGEESVNAVNQLRSRYDSEKEQHKLELIEAEHKAEKVGASRNILMLIVGILLLLIIIAFIFYRYRVKEKLNTALEKNNIEISMQKKSITDSINYAKKIQDSILPPPNQIKRVLPNSFILYEPKDVVSGDFYWLDSRDKYSIFSAVDCTGHGVPGALMSVIGFNLLNQAVNEMGLTKPSDILHHLDFGVNKLLRQSDAGNTVKDGMDIAICSYDPSTRKLQYAGAFNPAYIITKGEFIQLNSDKFPIGINVDGVADNYTNHEIQLFPGDMVYLFTDGYADQFGGPAGKKFKYTRFRELLSKIHSHDCEKQKQILKMEFVDWKGNLEQVDDILVIGLMVD
ncbi:MAG: tetratricopeptide repeat protein [Bacteroidetes bacterium]|nr:tetratricopeptide repeat protein [Bacteroidota bacterium]